MKVSVELSKKIRLVLYKKTNKNMMVTNHFVDRLIERSESMEVLGQVVQDMIKVLRDRLCELIFECIKNEGVTRVKVGPLKMICWFNQETMKLIIKTVY